MSHHGLYRLFQVGRGGGILGGRVGERQLDSLSGIVIDREMSRKSRAGTCALLLAACSAVGFLPLCAEGGRGDLGAGAPRRGRWRGMGPGLGRYLLRLKGGASGDASNHAGDGGWGGWEQGADRGWAGGGGGGTDGGGSQRGGGWAGRGPGGGKVPFSSSQDAAQASMDAGEAGGGEEHGGMRGGYGGGGPWRGARGGCGQRGLVEGEAYG